MEKIIKLQTKNGLDYFIKSITKEFNDELKVEIHNARISKDLVSFKLKYDLEIDNIEAYGDTKVSEAFLKDYIPYYIYHPFGDREKWVKSSKCYAVKEHDIKQNTLHYDSLSSWNCILQILNNPKYVLIYSKKIE